MKQGQYVNGFQQIHFIDGMVRLDMFVLVPREDGDPIRDNAGHLLMTPASFVSSVNTMLQFVDRLVEAGLLQRPDPEKPLVSTETQ